MARKITWIVLVIGPSYPRLEHIRSSLRITLMADLSLKHRIMVICASLLLISISVIATVFTVKHKADKTTSQRNTGYVNVTFTDAVLSCHEQTRKVYGSRIQTLTTDNHSSFISHQEFLYKIFLKMDLYVSGQDGTSLNYINCFVHTERGDIREYEVLEELVDGKPVDTSDTNVFGMPKKK